MGENTAVVLRLGARFGMCVLGGTGPKRFVLHCCLAEGVMPGELQQVHTHPTNG